MAQRKSTPANAGKSSTRPGGKPGQKSAQSALRKAGGSGSAAGAKGAGGAGGRTPGNRGKGKSIVNQKQTPWGMISVAVAVVLFAAAIVVVVVATRKSSTSVASASNKSGCTTMLGATGKPNVDLNSTSYLNELQCAKDIKGVTFKQEPNRNHVTTTVKYDSSPPVGGNHNQYWANCTGTVYSTQLANENAVHMLEHGAIWITYNPKTLSDSQLAILTKDVQGKDRMALTPYAGLKTPISLQAWGYQLFVQKATDPRIATFIKDLRYNTKTTPEYGASCSDPYFDPAQSYPGHPQNTPKSS